MRLFGTSGFLVYLCLEGISSYFSVLGRIEPMGTNVKNFVISFFGRISIVCYLYDKVNLVKVSSKFFPINQQFSIISTEMFIPMIRYKNLQQETLTFLKVVYLNLAEKKREGTVSGESLQKIRRQKL